MKKEFVIALGLISIIGCGRSTTLSESVPLSVDNSMPTSGSGIISTTTGYADTTPVYTKLKGTWLYQNSTCDSPYTGFMSVMKHSAYYQLVISGLDMTIMDRAPSCGFSIVEIGTSYFAYDLTNSGYTYTKTVTNYSSGCVGALVNVSKVSGTFVYRINGVPPGGVDGELPTGTNLGIEDGSNCDGYNTSFRHNYKKQ